MTMASDSFNQYFNFCEWEEKKCQTYQEVSWDRNKSIKEVCQEECTKTASSPDLHRFFCLKDGTHRAASSRFPKFVVVDTKQRTLFSCRKFDVNECEKKCIKTWKHRAKGVNDDPCREYKHEQYQKRIHDDCDYGDD